MALKRKTNTIKQIISLFMAMAVLALCVFLIYKNFVSAPKKRLFLFLDDNKESFLTTHTDLYEDNFFVDPLLRQFKRYGDWPVQPGKKGKANPFLPYFGD